MTDGQIKFGDARSEVGRELKASDLQPQQIVVLMKHDRPAITIWVVGVTKLIAVFHAAAARPPITLILRIQRNGTLKDDSGERIRVFEYLGEP